MQFWMQSKAQLDPGRKTRHSMPTIDRRASVTCCSATVQPTPACSRSACPPRGRAVRLRALCSVRAPHPRCRAIPVADPSVLWSDYYGQYILLGTSGGRDHGGWSFQLSHDMIQWSSPVALDTTSLHATGGPGGNRTNTDMRPGYSLYAYPSLLDPASPRRNYDSVGPRLGRREAGGGGRRGGTSTSTIVACRTCRSVCVG